uniref:Uncharacterized protein n=1 Tax=Anguilla anguilla TaxID=7936 RepID=A0A0E9T6U3_ANGAN
MLDCPCNVCFETHLVLNFH